MLNVLKLYEKNNLLAQFTPEPDRVYTFGSSREANCADAPFPDIRKCVNLSS